MSKSESKHDKYIIELMSLIENEKISFRDQYGFEHKVFNNKENEFMYKESVYFRNFIEPTLHNPYFPCQFIKEDTSTFEPMCNFEVGKEKILKENKCLECLKNAEGHFYKRQDFLMENTYIPDIGIGENGKFKYWIEVVNSHGCTQQKRAFINGKDFIVLEVHIHQIENPLNGSIECFNITNVDSIEYGKITEIFKGYKKISREPRKEKSYQEKQKSNPESVQYAELYNYIEELFLAIGKERFVNGQSLDYTKTIENIREGCAVYGKAPSLKAIENCLRHRHQCSILNLEGIGYPLSIVEQFKFQKRKSIIHTDVAKRFQKELKKFKKLEYIKEGYNQ